MSRVLQAAVAAALTMAPAIAAPQLGAYRYVTVFFRAVAVETPLPLPSRAPPAA